jgi:hypothetical protein
MSITDKEHIAEVVNQLRLRASFIPTTRDSYERPFDSDLDRLAADLLETLVKEQHNANHQT